MIPKCFAHCAFKLPRHPKFQTTQIVTSLVIFITHTKVFDGLFCREKDALWQKTDALEFEQKLRDEETERDVNYCLDCHSQFSWWIRKYNCRSVGFLYTVIEKPTVHHYISQ